MLVMDVPFAADLNWILEIRLYSNVFLQLKYGHYCYFGPNNTVEFGFFGKKSIGTLIIAKGIPFLASEGAQLDIVQLKLRRRERRLHSTKKQERTWMSINSKNNRH